MGGTAVYRVYIVEDDAVIASRIRHHICSWGLDAVCAEDFQHILEEFRRVQPQVVLMDISLPFFNGYHWCQEIRRESKVPVVFSVLHVGQYEHRHGHEHGRRRLYCQAL